RIRAAQIRLLFVLERFEALLQDHRRVEGEFDIGLSFLVVDCEQFNRGGDTLERRRQFLLGEVRARKTRLEALGSMPGRPQRVHRTADIDGLISVPLVPCAPAVATDDGPGSSGAIIGGRRVVPESQLYVVEIDGRVAEGFEQAPVNFQLPFKRVVLRLRPEPEETAQTMRSEATNPLFTERQTAAVRLLQLLHEGIKSLQGSTLLSGFAFGTQALLDAGAPRSRRSEPARDQVLMGHAGA